MKKFLTSLISTVVILCVGAASVLAVGSTEDVVEITGATDSQGNSVQFEMKDTSIPWLTSEIVSALSGDPASEIKVLWQKDLTAETLPATFTYNCNGTDGQKLYSCHWNGSAWELMNTGVGPTITTTYTSLSPVGVAVRVPASNANTDSNHGAGSTTSNDSTSPKTGDNLATYVTLSAVVIACSAAFVVVVTSPKKD